jgi:hypothetical protein
LPKQAKLSLTDDNQLTDRKRIKNIYDPGTLGIEVVPAVEEVVIARMDIPKELIDFVKTSKKEKSGNSSSLKTMFKDEDTVRVLATLDEFLVVLKKMEAPSFISSSVIFGFIYDEGDGAKFSEKTKNIPTGSKVISGAIVRLEEGPVFVPGESISVGGGEPRFVPGQRMSSVDGEFIPGAAIRNKENEFLFLPGVSCREDVGFVMGQFIEQDGSTSFVKGQVIHTGRGRPGRPGPLFLEGETVATADGLKLVAGLVIDTEIGPQFVCGGLVDMGEDKGSKFVPGQMLGGTKKIRCYSSLARWARLWRSRCLCPDRVCSPQTRERSSCAGRCSTQLTDRCSSTAMSW